MDDHLEEHQRTSSTSKESTPCLFEEKFVKIEDIGFGPCILIRHMKPKEVTLFMLYHTPLHKEFTYCSGHKFQPHRSTHESSVTDTDDLHPVRLKHPLKVHMI